MQFKYKAVDNTTGRIKRGQLEASNELNLESILRESNLSLISCSKVNGSFLSRFESVNTKDLISLFISLEQMERAGIPLIESVGSIASYTKNQKLKDIGQDLYESLKNGMMLSSAMEKHRKVFDDVSISLVAMGEKTGKLRDAFKSIVDNLKWSAEIKRKVKKALTGPSFTLLLMIAIAIGMLKFVVPTVLDFVKEQEFDIPSVTLSLVATTDFVNNYFLYILTIPILLFLIIKIGKNNKKFALKFDTFKVFSPVFGPLIQKIELSRFAKFFGLMFDAGISVLECLDITIKVVQNRKIKDEIGIIKTKVASGTTISTALSESSLFPPMVVKMFSIGETTGNMSESINNVNYFYETEINDGMERIIGMLKPIMLFMMGGLLIWIMVGVFGPLYGNFSKIM